MKSLSLICFSLLVSFCSACEMPISKYSFEVKDDRIAVLIDGSVFTNYIFKGQSKPYLYPIIGPYGTSMTRHWPMDKDKPVEERDHKHHTSLYYVHGNISGHDFWTGRGGEKVVLDKIISKEIHANNAVIISTHKWMTKDNKVLLKDKSTYTFYEKDGHRFLEYQIELKATEQDLHFGDSKEGTMAIRTNPYFRGDGKIKDKNGKPLPRAECQNSEGVKGKAMWGKKSKWLDYSATINGNTLGISIFDHPSNLRYPTTWHARMYGLVTANPFGLKAFKHKKNGKHTVKKGKSLAFKYLFVFHKGSLKDAKVNEMFEAWSGE